MTILLSELAERIAAELQGDGRVPISGVASLEEAGPGELAFVSASRYAAQAAGTRAGAVLLDRKNPVETPAARLLVDNVDLALEKVLGIFAPPPDVPAPGIHPSAVIAQTAQLAAHVAVGANAVIGENVMLGENTIVAPGCVIGRDVRIGRDCFLGPNVVVNWGARIGDRVAIHGNSTIATDGFGYRLIDGTHRKVPHIGIVVIEDDVEIGANSCVDRAKFGSTVIGRGSKLDNQVQIAHNVKIGENCIIIAQAGIAGSARLGRYVVLGGQVGVRDHVTIGDGVMAAATSAIDRDIEAGQKIVGAPAQPAREFFRMLALMQSLPEMSKDIKNLKKRIESALPENHR